MTITVVIADDQPLVRAGLRMIIDAAPDVTLVAEAGDGLEAVDLSLRLHPDVIIMDIRMPGIDGIEAARRLTTAIEQPPRIIILTTFEIDEYVYNALRAGASGFLLKDIEPEELTRAIRIVAQGDSLLAPSVTTRLVAAFNQAPATRTGSIPIEIDNLTQREREVLKLVAEGLSNAEIADHLVVTVATVKTHVTAILTKLQLRDRVQLVVFAYETGLIQARIQQPSAD